MMKILEAQSLFEQFIDRLNKMSSDKEELYNYLENKKKFFERLLSIKEFPIKNTLKNIANEFNIDIIYMVGFIDMINNYLIIPNNVEGLTEDTIVNLDYDSELLYEAMKESGENLTLWDGYFNKNNVNKLGVVNEILKSEDKTTLYYYLHENKIVAAKNLVKQYCNCNDSEVELILDLYLKEYNNDPEIIHVNAIAEELQNKTKCPTCSSTNIKRIGGGERAVSIAILGIFSKKINKSFECKNCGYTW